MVLDRIVNFGLVNFGFILFRGYPKEKRGCVDRWGLLHRNVQRFRDGLVFKAHILCVSLNSRLESNKERERGVSPCGS